MDEGSDAEDPERTLMTELRPLRAIKQAEDERYDFVQAAKDMVKQRLVGPQMAKDLERARMELEDMRSRALR